MPRKLNEERGAFLPALSTARATAAAADARMQIARRKFVAPMESTGEEKGRREKERAMVGRGSHISILRRAQFASVSRGAMHQNGGSRAVLDAAGRERLYNPLCAPSI